MPQPRRRTKKAWLLVGGRMVEGSGRDYATRRRLAHVHRQAFWLLLAFLNAEMQWKTPLPRLPRLDSHVGAGGAVVGGTLRQA